MQPVLRSLQDLASLAASSQPRCALQKRGRPRGIPGYPRGGAPWAGSGWWARLALPLGLPGPPAPLSQMLTCPFLLTTPPDTTTEAAPEVPPQTQPVTANQLFQRFLELSTRFGTKGRGFASRVPIGLRSGRL